VFSFVSQINVLANLSDNCAQACYSPHIQKIILFEQITKFSQMTPKLE